MIVSLANAKRQNGELTLEILKEINENEVDELTISLDSLVYYKQIKNLYKIAVENGNELIKFLKSIYATNTKIPLGDSEKVIMEGNRLIANYCSFIGMYIDQIEKVLSKIESKRIEEFRKTCSELYDKNIEYRFLVIMRNYIMHYDLPFTFYSESLYGRKLELRKEHLLKFSKWKQVKEDIIKMEDTINILPMLYPMNVNLTVIFFDFIYNIADKLLYAYQKAGDFVIKHKIKYPVIVTYETIEAFKNGQVNVKFIDFKELQEALNDIKAHPKISLDINYITPEWLRDKS
ncbi:hypothetical protein KPL47_08960 [Clostridium estertheticum]|uniref:hypothetical protein n=1 Tax=Clostridium estertheticum TaxID=238834 RepID=UPI001C0DE152|nr:hypothetical protein [Clostridium estertheticum]MBU3176502.1 hypothetical protein [Clostridium estertheticum]